MMDNVSEEFDGHKYNNKYLYIYSYILVSTFVLSRTPFNFYVRPPHLSTGSPPNLTLTALSSPWPHLIKPFVSDHARLRQISCSISKVKYLLFLPFWRLGENETCQNGEKNDGRSETLTLSRCSQADVHGERKWDVDLWSQETMSSVC